MSETETVETTTETTEQQAETVVLAKSEETPAPIVDSKPVSTKSFGERAYPFLAAATVLFAVAAVVLGVLWHGSARDYDALKSSQADRDRAAQVAKDYTLRSLTYDYRNLPAFFDGVQRGTSDALKDRYTQVHDTLAKIMTDAQVVATGDVVGTSVEAKGNDQYTVTVYATQKTQNVQQQDPATVPNLLVLTVAKNGGEWLVTDYGPKDIGAKSGAAK
ncbi:hypothetical protein [Nocardia sp. CDC160]|uniref:hypothetical protein n=1 Tax=Nocardia sp. CDC160 TaxID=3112166 RepID=UPI002DB7896F|nr:hypothetical protein [Nocardia sp. CDC160]MEC3918732.1 hypothetical protein [Nocardia sp. CDC160]